jgi:serine/threonine protein kinase
MPPELLKNGDLSSKCDVYSYGIIMWEVFTGQAPFAVRHGTSSLLMFALWYLRPGDRGGILSMRPTWQAPFAVPARTSRQSLLVKWSLGHRAHALEFLWGRHSGVFMGQALWTPWPML